MDPYPVTDHGMSGGPPPPHPNTPSPGLLQDQHLLQSIQHQQQQLHQQLATGSSSINDLIGMLPQTASSASATVGGMVTSAVSVSSSSSHGMAGLSGPMSVDSGLSLGGPGSVGVIPPAHSSSSSSLSHPPHHHHHSMTPSNVPQSPLPQGNMPLHLAGLGSYRSDSVHLGLQSPGGLYSRHPPSSSMNQEPPPSSSHALSSPHSSSSLSSHLPPGMSSPPPSSMPFSHSAHSMSASSQDSMSQSQTSPLSHQSGMSRRDSLSDGNLSSISYTRQGDSYVCNLCGKVVVSKAAITRHIQLTHEKRKPFECNICHRRFGYKNILLEHQNIHYGIKPYACTMCDKRFAARSNLFQHRLLHMKPYCCYICNKRFDRDDQLQRHLKLHPTANILSCSQCPFTASNVEGLNQHLQDNHKLLTYDTRRHSTGMEGDGDMHSQMVMSLPNPSLTSPDGSKSPGPHNLDNTRIDSICTQLASRGSYHDSFQVKQEPLSPGGVRFPPDMSSSHHFSNSSSPSRGGGPPRFAHAASPSSTICNSSNMPSTLQRSYSNSTVGSGPMEGGDYSGMMGRKDSPPIGGAMDSSNNRKYHPYPHTHNAPPLSPRGFMPPNRRASSVGMGPGAAPNQMRSNNSAGHSGTDHIRSIADSTSNISEFFSSLQGLVQRSQEIPELHVNISRPKQTKEVSTQYNNTSLPGELPTLEDLLIYYESQGCLYRCQHCRISFEERGLYFLHKSLHGEMSPWQCSICHKICADRNDFHLHFVNQQHHPEHTNMH